MDVEFSLLGPLEARRDGVQLNLGSIKRRALLAALLVRIDHVVPVSALIDVIWNASPPRTAHKNLQVYIAALRKDLGLRESLQHIPPGYRLRLPLHTLDTLEFEHLVRAGRRARRVGDVRTAQRLLGEALELWRGRPLPELAHLPLIAAEVTRLADLRLAAFEDWVETELELGHHARVVDSLTEWVRDNPYRERLRSAHLLALYRCGRQTEALAAFDDLRQALTRELGLRPSPVLERLYQAILHGSEDLEAPPPERDTVAHLSTLPRDLADFAGWVLSSRQAMIVDELADNELFAADIAESTAYVPRSLMAAPLLYRDESLGVLEVLDAHPQARTAIAELDLLVMFARQASVALRVTQIYSREVRLDTDAHRRESARRLLAALTDLVEESENLTRR